MRHIPYDPNDLLSINVLVFCVKHQNRRAFMGCPTCENFPCDQLDESDIEALRRSPLMQATIVGLVEKRRGGTMILVRKADGTIVESEIDINHPNIEALVDVAEVYVVNKVLVPVVVLRPKPKEERDKIMADRENRSTKNEEE